MTTDRPLLGITLMLSFCLMASLGDALAKILGASVPLFQFLLLRFSIQTALLVPVALALKSRRRPTRRVLIFAAWRTMCHLTGIGALYVSLRYLPLADALAIGFVLPFIVLFLGRILLGDTIGWHRIGACAVGFAGTLLVIQPRFAEVGLPALLPLAVAVSFAFFMLATRQISRDIDALTLQALNGVMAATLFVVLLPLGFRLEAFRLIDPGPQGITLLVLAGVLGTAAHLVMTLSLRFASPTTLAPVQYLEIPCAVLMGWLFFGDLPNGLAIPGIALIVGAGLYMVQREHRQARRLVAA
jgi:drug/metabolite transporter (DMT)-like permease